MSNLKELKKVLDSYLPAYKVYKEEGENTKVKINSLLLKLKEKALPLLRVTIKDDNHYIRGWTVFALGEFKEKANEFVPQISKLLYDPEAAVRLQAIETLEKIGTPKAIKAQIYNLKTHPNDIVSGYLLRSLTNLNAREIIPYLQKLLRKKQRIIKGKIYRMKEKSVLLHCVEEALLKFEDNESFPKIVKSLIENDKWSQFESIGYQAFPYLKEMFPNVDKRSKDRILLSYLQLGGVQLSDKENDEIVKHIVKILENTDNEFLLDRIVQVLFRFGPKAHKAFTAIVRKGNKIPKEKLYNVLKRINPDENLIEHIYKDTSPKDSIGSLLEKLEELDYKCKNTDLYSVEWGYCLEIADKLLNYDSKIALDVYKIILEKTAQFDYYDNNYFEIAIDKIESLGIKAKGLEKTLRIAFDIKIKQDYIQDNMELLLQMIKVIDNLSQAVAISLALDYVHFYEEISLSTLEILGKYKVKKATKKLLLILGDTLMPSDDSEEICAKVAWALGEIGDKKAISVLLNRVSGYVVYKYYEDEEEEMGTDVLDHFPKLEKEVGIALEKLGVKVTKVMKLENELRMKLNWDLSDSSGIKELLEKLGDLANQVFVELIMGEELGWPECYETLYELIYELDFNTKSEVYEELKKRGYKDNALLFDDLYTTKVEEGYKIIQNDETVTENTPKSNEKSKDVIQEKIDEEVMINRIRKIIGTKEQVALKYIELITKYPPEIIEKLVKENLGFKIIKGDIFQNGTKRKK